MTKRNHSFQGKRALVFGATGGIGRAVTKALAEQGAEVTGVCRHPEIAEALTMKGEIAGTMVYGDMERPQTMAGLLEGLSNNGEPPDHIVIAAGYDARKTLDRHTDADIEKSLAVNFESLLAICRYCYPRFLERGSGTVTYVGGFGDGSIAFPFYSVDAATRSAAATFLAALNREIPARFRTLREERGDSKVAGRGKNAIRFTYFGPTAVTTESEKAYLHAWKKMGTPIFPPERVANDMIKAIVAGKKSAPMGGFPTRLGIVLNAMSQNLADSIFMNGYRKIMAEQFLAADKEGA